MQEYLIQKMDWKCKSWLQELHVTATAHADRQQNHVEIRWEYFDFEVAPGTWTQMV